MVNKLGFIFVNCYNVLFNFMCVFVLIILFVNIYYF